MRIDVITLFPEWLVRLRDLGVTGRALREGGVDLRLWNPRDFTADRHQRVDDRPYGGGPGMVMQAEPLARAIEAIEPGGQPVTMPGPYGRRLDQELVEELADRPRLVLLCGRYEGVDQRFVDAYVDEHISLGDYVLSGGELAAAVIIDAVLRCLPGVLGHEDSVRQDSFRDGLLDCPHYTRPEVWRDRPAPAALLTGNHGEIARWRRQQALLMTWRHRPDLLPQAGLSREDHALLAEALESGET